MKGIDTNILVRYIIQDDQKQSALATHLLEKNCTIDEPAYINKIVLCELVWVLETAYGYARQDIAKVIEKILMIRQFQIDDPEIAWQSLRGYANEGADFADNYIGYINYSKGCSKTFTFDKKAARLHTFSLLTSNKS